MKIDLLSNGYFTLDKSLLVYSKYQGEIYEAALKPLLVSTNGERILIDTGIGELPPRYRSFHTVTRKLGQTLQMQLRNVGLKREDITVVINTHLHFDHCGNNKLFRNARFYVQADESRYAYDPDRFQKTAYLQEFFDVDLDYELLKGRCQVADGVTIVPTSGHSIGHQSVIIRDGSDNFVYCGDAAPLRENLEKRNIPGVLYRSDQALRSIDRLRAVENAIYIFSHDRDRQNLESENLVTKSGSDNGAGRS